MVMYEPLRSVRLGHTPAPLVLIFHTPSRVGPEGG